MTRSAVRWSAACAVAAAALALASPDGAAHKPITSPFTFNEDVYPIVRAQCGRCHVNGGVAPMSLMTHADAVPWGESIRAELMSGHMPPWTVERAAARFKNAQVLTARELNVLLTWASGGTPIGDADKPPAVGALENEWALGRPDLLLPLPREHTMAANLQEDVAEFTVATGTREPRWVRAVDVRPGTAAIVRAAEVRLAPSPAEPTTGRGAAERLLAMWVPGDDPIPLESGAFLLPAGAELVVRMHYRKTWEYERREMSDRSTVGVYFAATPAPELRAVPLGESGRVIENDVRALAIYPDAALDGGVVTVTAERPDGSREELIAFRPRRGWARRYWFTEPIDLPRGTKITIAMRPGDALLPPGALPPAAPPDPSSIRLTLNVIPRT